uniref:Uncharacterized protein n=1 Tax=Candidatus Kentrum sp. TC TaxID=2126339 RepID=A0A450YMB2_9GAMM|nr:MAG: hypothetical protein BECKTC1821E_GA0114239_102042 [Candidatus Kentron sp. TC]
MTIRLPVPMATPADVGQSPAKLRPEPTKHPALVKKNRRFVKLDAFAKMSGK